MTQAQVSDTAFVISCYRASDEALSGDPYSRHWVTPKAREWVRTYVGEVSPYEPFVHCLRNRFFLDRISAFFNAHPGAALVNVGCGFSAYPHLLPAKHGYLDADAEHVVALKRERLAQWEREGVFPHREVEYAAVDLDDADSRQRFEEQARAWLAGRPSFVLVEGVLVFLKQETIGALFEMFARVQKRGDRVGAVSFVPEIRQTAAYARFLDYYGRNLLGWDESKFTLIEDGFYERAPGYSLMEATDYLKLSRRYAPEREPPDADDLLNEHLYILVRS